MMSLLAVFVVFAFLLSYVVFRHFTWQGLPWPEHAVKPPVFQGHRGCWQEGIQENTLAAFEAAKEKGLTMVEMDVRLSKDGIPVVFHDSDLRRLGSSTDKIQDLTAAELTSRVQAPTLEQILAADSVPRSLNIELKSFSIWDGALEEAVARLIRKYQAENRVLFSSFNPLALWKLRRLLPQVPRALLVTEEKDPANKIYLRKMWLAPYIGIHALHLDHRFVSVEQVKKWRARKVPVALWTVNEQSTAEIFLRAGALSVITDVLGKTSEGASKAT